MAKSFEKKARKPLIQTGDFLDIASQEEDPKSTSSSKSLSETQEKDTKPKKKSKSLKTQRSHYTVRLSNDTQNLIKDIVYTKRIAGKFKYTQASAIEEAMVLLQDKMGKDTIQKDPDR